MRLFGYIRVSSEEQTKGFGLAMQLNAIRRYCKTHGHDLIRVYEDPGLSGASMDRPGLQDMLANLDQADGLIVWSLCRLSRDRIDSQIITDRKLWPARKKLFSTAQGGEINIETEDGRLWAALQAGFNQLDRIRIIERMTEGRKTKAQAGGYAGGRPCFGKKKCWSLDDKGNVVEKKLIEDPDEALVVEIIRRHARSGKSASAIARYLNASGYTTKTGKAWTHVQVIRVLDHLKRK